MTAEGSDHNFSAHSSGPTLLVGYVEAGEILGVDKLNAAIASGVLRPIKVNNNPGAPRLFPRSLVERLARKGG
jgi:hypothetical protein